MTRTSPSDGVPGAGRTAPPSGSLWRRLGAGGFSVVLAASLFGCASAETQGPPTPGNGVESSTGPQTGSEPQEDSSAGEGSAQGAEEGSAEGAAADAEEAEAQAAEAFRAAGSAEPGEPAVVEDDGTGEEARATIDTVSLGEEARPADGLEIVVESTRPVTAEGMGPGGVAGPAISVVVSVRNTTDTPMPTLGSSVTVTYGPDSRPAAPSRQPGDETLPTVVAPGQTASGTYTFLVPEDQREDLVITASYRATDPAAVFEGPALGDGAER